MKHILIKLHWLLASQLGVDPRVFLRSLRDFPIYLLDWLSLRECFTGSMKFMTCLYDRYEEGGATKNEYFWQDSLLARAIEHPSPGSCADPSNNKIIGVALPL